MVVGSWKLTEIEVVNKQMNGGIKRHTGRAEKKREISESTAGWRGKML